eukprot:181217-Chlamydomonas_euryale.AAC.1
MPCSSCGVCEVCEVHGEGGGQVDLTLRQGRRPGVPERARHAPQLLRRVREVRGEGEQVCSGMCSMLRSCCSVCVYFAVREETRCA